jgi:hypothetical protein
MCLLMSDPMCVKASGHLVNLLHSSGLMWNMYWVAFTPGVCRMGRNEAAWVRTSECVELLFLIVISKGVG